MVDQTKPPEPQINPDYAVWPHRQELKPGDQAPEGTAGSGENLCRQCEGRGHMAKGEPCPVCAGTGRVVELLSDA